VGQRRAAGSLCHLAGRFRVRRSSWPSNLASPGCQPKGLAPLILTPDRRVKPPAGCFRARRPSRSPSTDGWCRRQRRFAFVSLTLVAAPSHRQSASEQRNLRVASLGRPVRGATLACHRRAEHAVAALRRLARCLRARQPSWLPRLGRLSLAARKLASAIAARAMAPSHWQSALECDSSCGCRALRVSATGSEGLPLPPGTPAGLLFGRAPGKAAFGWPSLDGRVRRHRWLASCVCLG
jgi:hypothetical protein